MLRRSCASLNLLALLRILLANSTGNVWGWEEAYITSLFTKRKPRFECMNKGPENLDAS